jgi:NADH:ubiquinone oxidoreductase subunit F (NADH-binding)
MNGDEGDPGAYMDRSLMEGDPHAIIEGMIIGGYAIGAGVGIMYVRAEYPLAQKRLITAIDQARSAGLLGTDILGSGFDFELHLVSGAGAFVSGEETALINSVEGRIAEPCTRPPYPSDVGLYGQPTSINNVETWANIPLIVERGAAWYSSLGTGKNCGTKLFCLVGDVARPGLVEVPLGTSLSTFSGKDELCILCGRCVRACEALGVSAISFAGRGAKRRVAVPFDRPSQQCMACQACVAVCPTGAISAKVTPTDVEMVEWLTHLALERCTVCGDPFVTDREKARVDAVVGTARQPLGGLCPRCRRLQTAMKTVESSGNSNTLSG